MWCLHCCLGFMNLIYVVLFDSKFVNMKFWGSDIFKIFALLCSNSIVCVGWSWPFFRILNPEQWVDHDKFWNVNSYFFLFFELKQLDLATNSTFLRHVLSAIVSKVELQYIYQIWRIIVRISYSSSHACMWSGDNFCFILPLFHVIKENIETICSAWMYMYLWLNWTSLNCTLYSYFHIGFLNYIPVLMILHSLALGW